MCGEQQVLPPRVGTGKSGWYPYASDGSSSGAWGESVPSPRRVLAWPPECRYQRCQSVRARGHSCSSRQTLAPMMKSRSGASRVTPLSTPFSQWSNQRCSSVSRSKSEPAPKSTSAGPGRGGEGVRPRADDEPALARLGRAPVEAEPGEGVEDLAGVEVVPAAHVERRRGDLAPAALAVEVAPVVVVAWGARASRARRGGRGRPGGRPRAAGSRRNASVQLSNSMLWAVWPLVRMPQVMSTLSWKAPPG